VDSFCNNRWRRPNHAANIEIAAMIQADRDNDVPHLNDARNRHGFELNAPALGLKVSKRGPSESVDEKTIKR